MAKITPKFRTVLLFIILTGSYLNTYANYTPSFLNFLEIEYEGGFNIIKSNPSYPISSRAQSSFVFSIEKKISQIYGLYNFNNSIKESLYGKSLINYPFLNSFGLPINESAGHSVTLFSQTDVSCNGGNDGAINITVSGGTSPYTYQWSGNGRNDITQNITNLIAGTYTVKVTDSNNDEIIKSFPEITQPPALNATITPTNLTCNGANDGKISITNPQGGYGTYEYSINNRTSWQDSGNFTNLNNANYQVIIRDKENANCEITLDSNLIISEPPVLYATVTPTNVTCNGANDGTISITNPQGGYGTFQFSINNGTSWQTSGNFSNLGNANYQVLIRDKAHINCTIPLDSNLLIVLTPIKQEYYSIFQRLIK